MCVLIIGFLLVLVSSAGAQEEFNFVYGTNHFSGEVYSSTFIPPSVDTFYLIANRTSMVASRYTRVYYWPLTNEMKPDWDDANIIVDGKLEVLQNNELVETIEMTDYVIQYDGLDKIGTLQLYLGEDAVAARQYFESIQAQYRDDLFAYFEEMEVYREAFQLALAELQAGNITEGEMPEPPDSQQDLTLFSTNLLVGFPVNLSEGTYTVQLRLPDGSVQQDSQKRLVVFSSIREGVGYKVIPEERWSAPEQSKEDNEIIYSLSGKRIYLQPFRQIEFNELYYARLNNPQDKQARRDRNVWVPFDNVRNAAMELNSKSKSLEMDIEDYYVRQLTGSALGYEIVPHGPDSDRDVTFSGFEIIVDESEIHIQLIDLEGNALPYSQREIRILQIENAPWIYALSILPLIGGLAAIFLRRRSVDVVKTNK
jgi:hypothetical protein